jgi:hypothetical protein
MTARWVCRDVDCPAGTPSDNSDCTGYEGLSCIYPHDECTCEDGSWNCVRGFQ